MTICAQFNGNPLKISQYFLFFFPEATIHQRYGITLIVWENQRRSLSDAGNFCRTRDTCDPPVTRDSRRWDFQKLTRICGLCDISFPSKHCDVCECGHFLWLTDDSYGFCDDSVVQNSLHRCFPTIMSRAELREVCHLHLLLPRLFINCVLRGYCRHPRPGDSSVPWGRLTAPLFLSPSKLWGCKHRAIYAGFWR